MKLKTVEHDGKTYAEVRDGHPVYVQPDGKETAIDAEAASARSEDLAKQVAEQGGYIERMVVDVGLRDALLGVGVNPDLLDGAMTILKPSVKVKRLHNGDRRAVAETDLGEMNVAAFVKDWAQLKGKAYLGKQGGVAPGAGGKTMSRSEFEKLDPAAKMKAMTVDNVTVVS